MREKLSKSEPKSDAGSPSERSGDAIDSSAEEQKLKLDAITVPANICIKQQEILAGQRYHLKDLEALLCYKYKFEPLDQLHPFEVERIHNLFNSIKEAFDFLAATLMQIEHHIWQGEHELEDRSKVPWILSCAVSIYLQGLFLSLEISADSRTLGTVWRCLRV